MTVKSLFHRSQRSQRSSKEHSPDSRPPFRTIEELEARVPPGFVSYTEQEHRPRHLT
jgi:hypothetical protein